MPRAHGARGIARRRHGCQRLRACGRAETPGPRPAHGCSGTVGDAQGRAVKAIVGEYTWGGGGARGRGGRRGGCAGPGRSGRSCGSPSTGSTAAWTPWACRRECAARPCPNAYTNTHNTHTLWRGAGGAGRGRGWGRSRPGGGAAGLSLLPREQPAAPRRRRRCKSPSGRRVIGRRPAAWFARPGPGGRRGRAAAARATALLRSAAVGGGPSRIRGPIPGMRSPPSWLGVAEGHTHVCPRGPAPSLLRAPRTAGGRGRRAAARCPASGRPAHSHGWSRARPFSFLVPALLPLTSTLPTSKANVVSLPASRPSPVASTQAAVNKALPFDQRRSSGTMGFK